MIKIRRITMRNFKNQLLSKKKLFLCLLIRLYKVLSTQNRSDGVSLYLLFWFKIITVWILYLLLLWVLRDSTKNKMKFVGTRTWTTKLKTPSRISRMCVFPASMFGMLKVKANQIFQFETLCLCLSLYK